MFDFRIDLHCHSNFSDGALSPEALLEKAKAAQINLLALTDHDTLEGVKVLKEINRLNDNPITIINGIEISTRWKKYDIHILGLDIDLDNTFLNELIEKQRIDRLNRAKEIALRLENLGFQGIYDKAYQLAGHERLARPHFAQVLVNDGVVRDMQTAFKRYLGRGKPAYAPTSWVSIPDAIKGIHAARGLAVIAHPLKYQLTRTKLHELIVDFRTASGDALEVVSGEMTVQDVEEVGGLCLRFGLMASSGSDYHNEGARISLGQQRKLPLHCIPIWEKWNIKQGTL